MADATQSWIGAWYPNTMAQLIQIVGTGSSGTDGTDMPALSAVDTIALLGLVTPAVKLAIENFVVRGNGATASMAAVMSSAVDSTGAIVDGGVLAAGMIGLVAQTMSEHGIVHFVDASTYLQYSPDPNEMGMNSATPWKRSPPTAFLPGIPGADDSIQSYEVYYSGGTATEADLNFIRQMVSDYQRMVYASASAIAAYPTDVAQKVGVGELSEFLSALRALCVDMDVLAENPPAMGDITASLKYALSQSSEYVGKHAADIASEVGKEAGIIGAGLTGGFLENAGFLSIVVVGIVFHLFLR